MLHWFDKVVFYSMIALDDLPADILHRIAESCTKADLLALRLTSRRLSDFLILYVDKHLASEIRLGRHTHLHRAVATLDDIGGMMLARLLNASATVHQRDKNFETALHVASRLGKTDGVYSLLNAGSDVDALSAQQWTPLRLSCRYGHADIARILLGFGADANKPGLFGWTALRYASQNGHKDCMKVLLEYGATDTISHQSPGNTAADGLEQQWGIYKFSQQL